MILDYYGFREQPFGATPDSRYLFESDTHREALGSILYGIEAGRGFIALIAKPGMGKTTLLFRGLNELRGKGRTVFLFQTISTPLDFLRTLLADLGIQDLQGSFFELQAKLNEILLDQASRGERLVVVIDETQNLDDSVLELIRMLSNFETTQEKLMQIILSGQPQLARKLASPSLVQLRQRVSIIAHLRSFSSEETAQYISHRLRVAGYNSDRELFSPSALRLVAEHSEGIPRNINNICFNALSLGCATKQRTINTDTIRDVIADLDLDPLMELPSTAAKSSSPQTVSSLTGRIRTAWMWIPKATVASAVLLALSGVTMQGDIKALVPNDTPHVQKPDPSIAHPALLRSSGITKPAKVARGPKTTDTPLDAVNRHTDYGTKLDSRPEESQFDPEMRILVPPGMTLYQICAKTLKSCHSKELKEINRLNPWLTNPNHLESGKKLRMPSPQELAGRTMEPIASSPAETPK